MNPANKELHSVLDAFRGKRILVVGDVIVDHYIWGKVERITPEAPVVVVESTEEEKRRLLSLLIHKPFYEITAEEAEKTLSALPRRKYVRKDGMRRK